MTEEHSFGCIADQEAMGLHDLSKAQVYQKPKEMTKEELEKEAKESWWNDDNCSGALPTEKIYECGYLAGAEPREKQIQIDAEQIRALQKQNGELTDRVKELEAQIEKMKCCENCKYNSYWRDELHCNYGLKEALQEDKLVECKNMDKWEIKENDVC